MRKKMFLFTLMPKDLLKKLKKTQNIPAGSTGSEHIATVCLQKKSMMQMGTDSKRL